MVFGVLLVGLGAFLARQGHEDGDPWAGVLGLILNVVGVILGVVFGWMAWRDTRAAGQPSEDPPVARR
jgi:hypothetical protein